MFSLFMSQTTLAARGHEQDAISREALMALRFAGTRFEIPMELPRLPEELRRPPQQQTFALSRARGTVRCRGKQGGVRQCLRRRGNRPALPSIILFNARSLWNKMDELWINSTFRYECRDAYVMAVTETWLQPDVPEAYVEVDGFTQVRMDSDLVRTGKSCGGGVCLYISDRWCGCITVRETISDKDVELLCISLEHDTVQLIPVYRTLLKSCKPVNKVVRLWSLEKIEILKGCFLCTDWEVLYDSDIDRHNEIRTAYVKFCIDSVIPVKRIKHYSNNKPYITKEVKECINKKHLAFKQRDPELLILAQKKLNYKLRENCKNYRDLIDSDLSKS